VRWAAVIAVGCIAIAVITMRDKQPAGILSDKKLITVPKEKLKQEAMARPGTKQESTVSRTQRKTVSQKKGKTDLAPPQAPVKNTEAAQVDDQSTNDGTIVGKAPQQEKESVAAAPSNAKPIVLVYTLDPVIPVTQPVAVDNSKKDSQLEKVVKYARDVKNGDSPFGLRVVREDLFAHDPKKKTPTKNH
jgi:hypothetical protein